MTNKNYYAAMIISDGEKNYPIMQKFDKFDNIAHFFQGRHDIVAANWRGWCTLVNPLGVIIHSWAGNFSILPPTSQGVRT